MQYVCARIGLGLGYAQGILTCIYVICTVLYVRTRAYSHVYMRCIQCICTYAYISGNDYDACVGGDGVYSPLN